MNGDPVLLRAGEQPTRLKPKPFPKELDLQALLAENPSLLPGGDGDHEHLWMLVTRELPIEAEGTGFYLDLLFLDEEGVPTLVECKLAWNPEARRAVIGQGLDYASWFSVEGSDAIRRHLIARCGDGADRLVVDTFGDEDDFSVEGYWDKVDAQLAQRRMRLLFAGDSISPLVRRVAEFLNREMRNVEVLAVEYAVWEDDTGLRLLLPTVHGRTVESDEKSRRAASSKVWTLDEWLVAFNDANGDAATAGLRQVIDRWREQGGDRLQTVVGPGVGKNVALHIYLEDHHGTWVPALRAYPNRLVFAEDYLAKRTWVPQAAVDRYREALVRASRGQAEVTEGQRIRFSTSVLIDEAETRELVEAMAGWATDLKACWPVSS